MAWTAEDIKKMRANNNGWTADKVAKFRKQKVDEQLRQNTQNFKNLAGSVAQKTENWKNQNVPSVPENTWAKNQIESVRPHTLQQSGFVPKMLQTTLRPMTEEDKTSPTYQDRNAGGDYWNSPDMFPTKAGDVSPMALLKTPLNFAAKVAGAPGSYLRRFALLSGGKYNDATIPQQTSFNEDILPKKASEALNKFERNAPISGAIAKMALETLADPATFIGTGEVKAGAKALENMSSTMARNTKVLGKLGELKKAETIAPKLESKLPQLAKQAAETLNTPQLFITKNPTFKKGKSIDEIMKDFKYPNIVETDLKYASNRYEADILNPFNEKFQGGTIAGKTPEEVKNKINDYLGKWKSEGIKLIDSEPLNDQISALKMEEPSVSISEKYKPIKEQSMTVPDILPAPSSKIVMEANTPKKSFKEALNSFYTRVVDTNNPGREVGEEFYTKATNSKSVGGIVDHNLTSSLVDVNGNRIGDSLKQVAEQIPKGKEEDFWTYMSQRHNIDRAREGKNVQMNYTPEMSKKAVSDYESLNTEYKQVGDNITKWIDDFMKTWGVDTGIVNKDIYGELRNTYKSYFPTQRDFSTLEKSIPNGMSSKFIDLNSPIKKATGSERDIKNPIENIMNLVNRTVRTAKYNEVGKSLLESVRNAPDKLSSIAEIVPTNEGLFSKMDNIVTVLENGKPTYLKINDKPLLDMLNGLPKSTVNVKVLSKLTSGFKSLITQKNPLFAVRNIARDIPTYLVNSSEKNIFKSIGNLGGAVKDIATNSENLQRYKGLGGGGANFFNSGNVSKSAKELTGNENIFKKVAAAPLKGIEKFNNLTETAPRLAEFNNVFRKTGNTDKALFAANDVTTNFSRGGNITKALDRNGVPYLNAGVQGLDKTIRQFKGHPIATILKGATVITAPQLIVDYWNKDNPYYKELDNRTKDNYILIPNGLGETDESGYAKTFIKIPKSREFGVLFSSLIQRTLNQVKGDDEAFKGFGNTVATNFAPTNPIENNILSPLTFNIPTNKDFAGRAIVPLGMEMDRRSPYLQYDETTSIIAKKLGEVANLSPKQIDYVIKSYTGVIGQLGLPAVTERTYNGDNITQKLFKPIATQFTADPLYSNNTLTNFYENMDKLSQKATDKNIIENVPPKKKTAEETIRNKFTNASKDISDLNKEIKKAIDEEAIRSLKKQILDIANKTNSLMK